MRRLNQIGKITLLGAIGILAFGLILLLGLVIACTWAAGGWITRVFNL